MKNTLLIAILAASSTACQTQISRNNDGHYIDVTNQAELTLHKALTISPGRTRTYIQQGQVVSSRDQYEVSCVFEVHLLSDKPQLISPDKFQVLRTEPGATEVVRAFPVKVASNAPLSIASSDSPPDISQYYHFNLSSQQTNVKRMSCYGAFNSPPDAYAPSLHEINQTLKGLATLKL